MRTFSPSFKKVCLRDISWTNDSVGYFS